MKKKSSRITISTLLLGAFCFFNPTYANSIQSMTRSEHWAAGQNIQLQFAAGEQATTATPLHLSNGLVLSFADILSLGDIYGILGSPISHEVSKEQKQARFKQVFNSFAKRIEAPNEIRQLTEVIHNEFNDVAAGLELGETPEDIYKRIGNEVGRQINCITGGGCTAYGWWLYPGRYLHLAMEHYDHFSPNNLIVYKQGHKVALEQALKAKKTGKRVDLEKAYAMEAFAAHFLADHYAAGYLRTPHEALKKHISPAILGTLLAEYMRYEENKYGVEVHNKQGDSWRAYGDFSYYNPFNGTNKQMLAAVLQQSADEIFSTYDSEILPTQSSIADLLPQVDAFNMESDKDIAPMFYWDESSQQLYRRVDLSNPYDNRWTNNWWGWSTIIELKSEYGITSPLQLGLSKYLSQFADEQIKQQLVA